ncbi:hypothetical protein KIN20_025818 [Parelaphostrongylus tenuis]|uniref:Uncharacterized protein n=1 Tax=Parelaphostrongylus tenuis TaxID=148309 RepID=A0AAD5NC43_PARTN|nr:hypothetical protein KIN20_025818 [Parelaphostrongylus tenuis]
MLAFAVGENGMRVEKWWQRGGFAGEVVARTPGMGETQQSSDLDSVVVACAPGIRETMLLRLCMRNFPYAMRRHTSIKTTTSPEPRFSESAAFQGRRKRGAGVVQTPYRFDYYTTDEFNNKKLLSALGSLAVFILYFAYLREPSDLDEIWNAPPHVLTANFERKMLREQIKQNPYLQAEEKGQDTTLLKAELDYVDVKEAALKIQFQQQNQKRRA